MYEILTKDYLESKVAAGYSSKDIASELGGNPRTVRWYMKKYGVVGLKTKTHPVWNKGLTATDDSRVAKSTEACHAATRGKPSWNKGKELPPLSEEQKAKIGASLKGKYTGENNANWRGGTSPENKRIRMSADFKHWRKAVFERDNYTCQSCSTRGGVLHPHHIKPFAAFPELRFEISNGLTLCEDCHKKTDSWGSNRDNTKCQQTRLL